MEDLFQKYMAANYNIFPKYLDSYTLGSNHLI